MTVFLVGLDGLSVEYLTHVMARMDLPNFKRAVSEGKPSPLISVIPYVSAPAWTSLFSGVNPGKHGVFDMFKVEANGSGVANMQDSDAKFLWDYLSWANKRVLVLGVPCVFPAPKINGTFITGAFAPQLSCSPSEVASRVDISGYDYESEIGADEAAFMAGDKSKEALVNQMVEGLRKRTRASVELIDSEKWDAVLMVDHFPDRALHFLDQDSPVFTEVFRILDDWLGDLFKRLGKDDQMILCSDHGFSPVDGTIFINEWLIDKGYLRPPQGRLGKILDRAGIGWGSIADNRLTGIVYRAVKKVVPGAEKAALGMIDKNLVLDPRNLDDRTTLYPLGSREAVAWIWFRNKGEASRLKANLLADLNELKEQGLVRRVIEPKDIYRGKYTREVEGLLLVEAREGLKIDPKTFGYGKLVGRSPVSRYGGHRQKGFVAFVGPNKPRSGTHPTVYDITPTVLSLFRLPSPEYIDGVPLLETSH